MGMDLVMKMYEEMGIPMGKPSPTTPPTVTGKLYLRHVGQDEGSGRDLYIVVGVVAIPEGVVVGDGSDVRDGGEGGEYDKGRMTVIAGHVRSDDSTIMMELYQDDRAAWFGVDDEDRKMSGDSPSGMLTKPVWQV